MAGLHAWPAVQPVGAQRRGGPRTSLGRTCRRRCTSFGRPLPGGVDAAIDRLGLMVAGVRSAAWSRLPTCHSRHRSASAVCAIAAARGGRTRARLRRLPRRGPTTCRHLSSGFGALGPRREHRPADVLGIDIAFGAFDGRAAAPLCRRRRRRQAPRLRLRAGRAWATVVPPEPW